MIRFVPCTAPSHSDPYGKGVPSGEVNPCYGSTINVTKKNIIKNNVSCLIIDKV